MGSRALGGGLLPPYDNICSSLLLQAVTFSILDHGEVSVTVGGVGDDGDQLSEVHQLRDSVDEGYGCW